MVEVDTDRAMVEKISKDSITTATTMTATVHHGAPTGRIGAMGTLWHPFSDMAAVREHEFVVDHAEGV